MDKQIYTVEVFCTNCFEQYIEYIKVGIPHKDICCNNCGNLTLTKTKNNLSVAQ